jgi:hypothetical protein
MKTTLGTMLLVTLALTCASVQAGEPFWKRFDYEVGLASKLVSMDVTDSYSGDLVGQFETELRYLPYASISTEYDYFGETPTGYYITFKVGPYKLKKQKFDEVLVNVGSKVEGWHAYASPVFFFDFLRNSALRDKHSFKAGLGVGAGLLKSEGNIFLVVDDEVENHQMDFTKLTLSVAVLLEYQYGNLVLRGSGGGPVILGDDYDYQLVDVSVDMGYVIRF